MNELQIGAVLSECRHKQKVTQEELAEYLGVSKAAVSKWETGASYPDITLLPRLATFFHLSLEELLAYRPQLTREEIRTVYRRLSAAFSSQPLEQVLEQCRQLAKEYYSCFPLLFQLGSLYVNHTHLASGPEQVKEMLQQAMKLFVRVKNQSREIGLIKQARNMEAYCLLNLGHTKQARCLLEPLELSTPSAESLLASAYHMEGNQVKAQEILQAGIFQDVVGLINLLASYLSYSQTADELEETWKRIQLFIDGFRLKSLHPGLILPLYPAAAVQHLKLGQREQALDRLEEFTQLATSDIYPLKLHGDQFFTLLDHWLESTLELGNGLPRDEAVIRKSIAQSLTAHPAFASLAQEPRSAGMIARLKASQERSS